MNILKKTLRFSKLNEIVDYFDEFNFRKKNSQVKNSTLSIKGYVYLTNEFNIDFMN